MSHMTPVHFIGMLRSPVSWAKVGRELIRGLASSGAHVSAVSTRGFLYDEAFPLGETIEAAVGRQRLPGWDLALIYPPNFLRLTGTRKAGILIYEADRFPSHWAGCVETTLEKAIVPSEFCRRAAVAAGISPRRLAVAPFGVSQDIYRPDGPRAALPTGRSFNFLAVAAPHVRKGLTETVAAFAQAFSPGDDVGLVIKCPPLAGLGKRPWEYASVADFLPDGMRGRVAVVEGVYGEDEMAALYRSSDVYVQASYGEGFGLSIYEAAACGRPVIITGWGAAVEAFTDESAWLIKSDPVDAAAFAYDWNRELPLPSAPVQMARPCIDHLAQLMRQAYESESDRAAKADAALRVARRATWSAAAAAIVSALEN